MTLWITLCIHISRERSGLEMKIWESYEVHMDLEVSEDREEYCEPGAEIVSECLEEGIIKRRFMSYKVKDGEMVLQLNGVRVSERWSFFKRVGE